MERFRIEHGHPGNGHLRVLHTSDWQLGMTRWFLGEDQVRYTDAQFEAIKQMGELADARSCEVVIVAGDVFDAPMVNRRIQERFLDVLRTFTVPVLFLPGNHDPYQGGALWTDTRFMEALEKAGGHVLLGHEPFVLASGHEIYGAPLTTNTPITDLVADTLEDLEPTEKIRILVGHGATSSHTGELTLGMIDPANVDRAIREHRVDYVALGDTHSTMNMSSLGAMWYSGAHQPTDFDDHERDSGNVLVVDIALSNGVTDLTIDKHRTGTWAFHADHREVSSTEDVEQWAAHFQDMPNRSRTVVRYSLAGTLDLGEMVKIENHIEEFKAAFAAFYQHERKMDLHLRRDSIDIDTLPVAGYLKESARQLAEGTTTEDRDALALLLRLIDSTMES